MNNFQNYIQQPPYFPGKGARPLLPRAKEAVTTENFKTHQAYQLGFFLFSKEYFWEAHEVWESVWKLQSEPFKTFVQALIKLTAAGLKAKQNEVEPAKSLIQSAQNLFQNLPSMVLQFDCDHCARDLKNLESLAPHNLVQSLKDLVRSSQS